MHAIQTFKRDRLFGTLIQMIHIIFGIAIGIGIGIEGGF